MELSSQHAPKTVLKTPLIHSTSVTPGPDRKIPGELWIYRLVRTALGIIFIWSSVSKLSDPQSFATIIGAYGLIPEATILPVAIGLSVLELLAGAGLLLDMQGSLGIIAGLSILFAVILSYGLWIGLDVDCGCFGPDDPEGAAYHALRPALYRDMVMLAGIGYLFLWRWRKSVYPIKYSDIYQIFINIRWRKWQMKNLLVFAVVTLLVIGFGSPAMAKNKFEKEVEKEADAAKLVHEIERGGYKIVKTDELKQWIDSKKDMIIVDTMPYQDSYKKGHVPGAKQFLFPIPEMTAWDTTETDGKSQSDFEALLGTDKNKTIVIYCGFVKCTRSHNGAAWAVKLGYKNVYRHPGGIFAWKGAGYPVAKVK